ncbi:MAG: response regulator transcription factor [Lachnospiraceae bacterium]|nr:response regulator transcription factor [Lachnospiraceae bacterium]
MKILYAEDEKGLSMAVAEILKLEGYEVDAVYDGAAALDRALGNRYDAMVLDIMMPQLDGVSVLKKLREAQDYTPVLLLTAKAELDDRITGLKAGADDYLAKPFAMKELVARIEAMTRRNSSYVIKDITEGNLTLDCENNEVRTDKGSLVLSRRETALLAFFLQNLNAELKEEELFSVLKTEEEDEMAVLLYVTYLKNKLRQIHAEVRIEQEEGLYRMVKGVR